jgi:hypothetical protein
MKLFSFTKVYEASFCFTKVYEAIKQPGFAILVVNHRNAS